MIYYIWIIGSIVTFMLLMELIGSIRDSNDIIDKYLGEDTSNSTLFIALLLVSLGWPFVIIILILDLFNENS